MEIISEKKSNLAEDKEREELLQSLGENIAQFTKGVELLTTPIPGLSLFRSEDSDQIITHIYEPSICLITQGEKRIILGEEMIEYDHHHFLLASVHLPAIVQITPPPNQPILGIAFKLDRTEISQLMVDCALPLPTKQASSLGMTTGELNSSLLNAFKRLVDLLF